MTKATEELLASLHGHLADTFLKKLQSGEYTASDLNVIRQFLKDNSIEAGPANTVLPNLVDTLPFPTAVNE